MRIYNMTRFWNLKIRKFFRQSTALVVVGALLFSALAPPFAHASYHNQKNQNHRSYMLRMKTPFIEGEKLNMNSFSRMLAQMLISYYESKNPGQLHVFYSQWVSQLKVKLKEEKKGKEKIDKLIDTLENKLFLTIPIKDENGNIYLLGAAQEDARTNFVLVFSKDYKFIRKVEKIQEIKELLIGDERQTKEFDALSGWSLVDFRNLKEKIWPYFGFNAIKDKDKLKFFYVPVISAVTPANQESRVTVLSQKEHIIFPSLFVISVLLIPLIVQTFQPYCIVYILLLLPGSSIVHELGHYLFARLFNRPAKLRISHVLITNKESLSYIKQALISFAGPFFNLLFVFVLIGINLLTTDPTFILTNTYYALFNFILFISNLVPISFKKTKFDGYHIREIWRKWIKESQKKIEITSAVLTHLDLRYRVHQESYEDLKDRLNKINGNPQDIEIITQKIEKVIELEPYFNSLSYPELKVKTDEFKRRIRQGETLDDILPEAFALVREATSRVLGKKQYVEQIAAAIGIHTGLLVEQKTGEGKTLSIALAVYLNALAGPVDVYTYNEYLALRDADEVGNILTYLGLKVGALQSGNKAFLFSDQKGFERDSYNGNLIQYSRSDLYREADVIYGYNSAFIFDYLYDYTYDDARKFSTKNRKKYFAIIDEADAELLEEANTNYRIVSKNTSDDQVYFHYIYTLVSNWQEGEDFSYDAQSHNVILTDKSKTFIEILYKMDRYFQDLKHLEIYIKNALNAIHYKKLNIDYIIFKDKITIIDPHTGRLLWSRNWDGGLHQFVEIKEGLNKTPNNILASTIGLSNFMKQYQKLSGITGTIGNSDNEFSEVYSLRSIRIPWHHPFIRNDLPDKIFLSNKEKIMALVTEAREEQKKGRPVLIGTKDVAESILVSSYLKEEGTKFNILNGLQKQGEKEIIEQAGNLETITVATQLAGRGTDIIIEDSVIALGGLHVIDTVKSNSKRVDDQLKGRSGRQGLPGSSRQYLSLEDDLIVQFSNSEEFERLKNYTKSLPQEAPEITNEGIKELLNAIQKRAEFKDIGTRIDEKQKDDLMHQIRSLYFDLRDSIFDGKRINRNLSRNGIYFWHAFYFISLQKRYALNALQDGWVKFVEEYENISFKQLKISEEQLKGLFHSIVLQHYKEKMKSFKGFMVYFKNEFLQFFEDSFYQKVIKWFSEMFNHWSNETYYLTQGKYAMDRKQYEKAIQIFTKAIELNSKSSAAYLNRGLSHFYNSNYDDSQNDFINVLTCNDYDVLKEGSPYVETAINNLAIIFFNRGIQYEKSGNKLSAALNFRIAHEMSPGGDFDKALETAKSKLNSEELKLLKVNLPFMKYIYLHKARKSVDSNSHENAIYYFNRVLEIDPTLSTAHFGRSWSLNAINEIEQANKTIRIGLKYHISQRWQWKNIKLTYTKTFNESMDRSLIEGIFLNLEKLLSSNNSKEDSEWQTVSIENIKESSQYSKAGRKLLDSKNYRESVPYFNKALELNPYNYEAYGNRGEAYFAAAEYEKSMEDWIDSLRYEIFENGQLKNLIAGYNVSFNWTLSKTNLDQFFENLKITLKQDISNYVLNQNTSSLSHIKNMNGENSDSVENNIGQYSIGIIISIVGITLNKIGTALSWLIITINTNLRKHFLSFLTVLPVISYKYFLENRWKKLTVEVRKDVKLYSEEYYTLRDIEASLGGKKLEEDIYTVFTENSHEQNIRLILNQPELELNEELSKEFVDRIEEDRRVQLVIVTDPKQMDETKVKEILLEKGVPAKFIESSSFRIIYESMKADGTFSFRNMIRKPENRWLKEGDYSNWVLNHTKRWTDLIGQILSDFFIKDGIELLELDLKTAFITRTSA